LSYKREPSLEITYYLFFFCENNYFDLWLREDKPPLVNIDNKGFAIYNSRNLQVTSVSWEASPKVLTADHYFLVNIAQSRENGSIFEATTTFCESRAVSFVRFSPTGGRFA
jgi:hypothetical protein